MSFQTFQVNIVGPSYQVRSKPLSSQSTVNMYQEFDESGRSQVSLQSWPGQVLLGSVLGADRGMHKMANVVYRVAGGFLYEVSSTGEHIERGPIAGESRCIFSNDGENLFIVSAGLVYQYNSQTKEATAVTDPDIVGSNAVSFLNNQFIYTKPNLFIVSDVGNGASASGLNAAQAESQPDDLTYAYVFGQVVYMIGEESVEPWYNSGAGSPPFERIDTQIISVGTAALHSVASNDNFMYWLGDDRQVYQATSGTQNRVSSIAIAHAMESYADVSDAIGMTLTLEGQNFYILTFPSANKTWAISEGLGDNGWFELSAGTQTGKYNITSIETLNGIHYGADETSGALYRLSLDAYDNDGEIMQRIRTSGSIHGGLAGALGKRVQMSRLEVIMEMGVGTISGQGEDPRVMIEASTDGGKSFGAGEWMRIGRLGETNVRAEWFSMMSFYDLIVRLTITDPVPITIQSAAIDARLAGR